MGTFKPHINLPGESAPHAKWLEKFRKDQEKLNSEIIRFMSSYGKGASTGARQTTDINVRTRNLENTVVDISGVPDGGFRGSLLARDSVGKLKWTTPIGSVVPRYFIYLNAAGSSYEVGTFGSATTQDTAKMLLPEPLFEYNQGVGSDVTKMDWPISWGDEWNSFGSPYASSALPIDLEIYVEPTFNGEKFLVQLPSSQVVGAPWFTLNVNNETSFSADLTLFGGDALFYDGGAWRDHQWDIQADERATWRVDTSFHEGAARLQPFWRGSLEGIQYPTDGYYWKNVRALEHQASFNALGNVATLTGALGMTNARTTHVRIGKLTARVGTAPTGSGVQVQFYKNGTTAILSAPLEIPAGQVYAEAAPNAATSSLSAAPLPGDPLVLLAPGEFLTVSVLAVGSTTPGTNLTVQVYYG